MFCLLHVLSKGYLDKPRYHFCCSHLSPNKWNGRERVWFICVGHSPLLWENRELITSRVKSNERAETCRLTAQLCSSSPTTEDSNSENCVTHPVLILPISINRVKKFFRGPADLYDPSLRLSTQGILDCINLPTKTITGCIWPENMAIFAKWGNLGKS